MVVVGLMKHHLDGIGKTSGSLSGADSGSLRIVLRDYEAASLVPGVGVVRNAFALGLTIV